MYYYKVMSFSLKNAKATYQRLVNKVFADKIGRTMEAYVDNIKLNLEKCTFTALKLYNIKPNLEKCTFGVEVRKFLCFMSHKHAIATIH